MFTFIKKIFGFFWGLITWTRVFIFNLLFLFIVVALIQGASDSPEIEIPQHSALLLTPSGALVDQISYDPSILDAFSEQSNLAEETLVRDITRALHHAKNDKQITGVILNLDHLHSASMSKVEEIGQAIHAFRASNKPVIAYADSLSQQQYLLASYADEIYLNPMGNVGIYGFGVFRNYYKSAAEKLAIKFHVFRVGQYKDAVEPFMRDNMSEASHEHIGSWLSQIWHRYTGTLEAHRDLPKGAIDDYVNQLDTNLKKLDGDAARLALESGLIDGLYSRLQVAEHLKEKFGRDKKDRINSISMNGYLNNPGLKLKPQSTNKIGLIVASGNIYDGRQAEGNIGADSFTELLRQAQKNKDLDALVVRIDSGGGSAFASEVIREEIQNTRDNGLPVYVSMGSVAASGGYWIAMAANEVWATPSTLTGSIGVFGIIPNVHDSLQKLGIYSDGVGTAPLADALRIDREMSDQAARVIQSGVDNIYKRFIGLVADARESAPENIHSIAQGRVWSGTSALELGLIDKLGSLDDLFESIAQTLELSDYAIEPISRKLSPKEQFIRTVMEQTHASLSTKGSLFSNTSLSSFLHTVGISDEMALANDALKQKSIKHYAQCIECDAP